MKTPTGYVALRKGRNNVRNCIFLNWFDAEIHISDFDEAEYSVIDSLQDAEKFIVTADCSHLEVSSTIDTSPGQSQVVNTEIETNNTTATATLPPPPLPLDTIDIDATNATPTAHPLAKNQNNNETPEQLIKMMSMFPSTDAQNEISLKEKFSITVPKATPHLPDDYSTNDANDNPQQHLGAAMIPSPCIPAKPSVLQNQTNNKDIADRALKAYLLSKTAVQNYPSATVASVKNHPSTTTAATAAVKNFTPAMPRTTTTVVLCPGTKKINKEWKNKFEKLVTYRLPDGTFPKPTILDHKLRTWYHHQNGEYNKKVKGKTNTMSDEKEQLLRSVGFIFNLDRKIEQGLVIEPPPPVCNKEQTKKDVPADDEPAKDNPAEDRPAIDKPAEDEPMECITEPNNVPKEINQSWKDQLAKLKEFVDSHDGTWNVREKDDPFLRSWILTQKSHYFKMREGKPNSMNEQKLAMLREIGVDFDKNATLWAERIEQLKQFKKEYGHLYVPSHYPELGRWVQSMIRQYKQMQSGMPVKLLDSKKIDDLRKAGVDFLSKSLEDKAAEESPMECITEPKEINQSWKDQLAKLKEFMDLHDGKWNVREKDDPYLRSWILTQKSHYLKMKEGKPNSMNEQKLAMLREIGVDFDKNATLWAERIEQLKQFKKEHGHLYVPRHYPELGRWVESMIRQYKQMQSGRPAKLLDSKKIDDLRKAGVDFLSKIDDRPASARKWNEKCEIMLAQLKEYKDKYGSARVKQAHQEYHDLYNWCIKVQVEYKKLSDNDTANTCRLTAQHMARLTELGFQFLSREPKKTFDERIEQLKEFQRNGGDISKISCHHPEFGRFVGRQRLNYRYWCKGENSTMNEERIKILEDIGFQWNTDKWVDPADRGEVKTWDERFQQLLDYKVKHGHAIVPQKTPNGLGQWVKRQRKQYKLMQQGEKSSLTAEKALQLSNIGFVFDASSYRFKRKHENNNNTYMSDQNDEENDNNNETDSEYLSSS